MTDTVGYGEMVDAGVSYRRLHHWTTRGLLRAENPDPGSGRALRWPAAELGIAQAMVVLVDHCEMSPAMAQVVARTGRMEITDDIGRVVVTWDPADSDGISS